MGEIILQAPWGWTYTVNEVLAGDKAPHFVALDPDGKKHSVELEIVK